MRPRCADTLVLSTSGRAGSRNPCPVEGLRSSRASYEMEPQPVAPSAVCLPKGPDHPPKADPPPPTTRKVSLPMASRSAGMQVMTRAPPLHDRKAVRLRTFALLRTLETPVLGLKPDVEGVSQVGKSPSGHLFESLTSGCIVFEIDLPDLNPHTACSTRVEPPRSSAPECTNAAGVCAISDRGVWLGWRCTRSARCRHACCLPRSRAGGRTRGPSRHCSASSLLYAERPPPSVRTNEPCLS